MRSTIKKINLMLSTSLLLSTFTVARAVAATAENCKSSSGFLGFPTWYKYLKPEFTGGECKLNATFPDDIGKILLAVVDIMLRVGGLVAIAFVVYGGFKYIISQGEPEKTKSSRQTIVNAVIGLVISMMATAIVTFIGREFTN